MFLLCCMLALEICHLVVLDVGTLETSHLVVLYVGTLETSRLVVLAVGTLESSHPPSLIAACCLCRSVAVFSYARAALW